MNDLRRTNMRQQQADENREKTTQIENEKREQKKQEQKREDPKETGRIEKEKQKS
jgi:hypothetical protein